MKKTMRSKIEISIKSVCGIGAFICLLNVTSAQATLFTWQNTNGGNWNTASNWANNAVPASGDDVVITADGTYTVTLNVAAIPKSLALGGAVGTQTLAISSSPLTLTNASSVVNSRGTITLQGNSLTSADLTIAGVLDCSAGTISGALNIATNGTLVMNAPSYVSLYAAITNAGWITWSGSGYFAMNGGTIHNLSTGLIDVQVDSGFGFYRSSGSPVIINDGVLRKSGGAGNFPMTVPIINSGILDAQTGRVLYANGSIFNDGTVFAGAGTNSLHTGTAWLYGTITSSNLVLSSGLTVKGAGSLVGTAEWSGGTISGTLNIATNSTLTMNAPSYVNLSGSITNAGRINLSSSGYLDINGGTIHNLANGLIDVQMDSVSGFYKRGGLPLFINDGVFRKSGGAGNFPMTVPIVNSGILDTQTGRVLYAGGSVFNNGTVFSGSGTNSLHTGDAWLYGTITSSNLVLSSGITVKGTGLLVGTANWSGGTIAGTLNIATNSTLTMNTSASVSLTGAITNAGRINWISSGYMGMHGGTIHNLSQALFDVQVDSADGFYMYSSPSAIVNDGVFRKSGGTGNFAFKGVPIINSGILDVQAGWIDYTGGGSVFNDGTTFMGAGTNLLSAGTASLYGDIHSSNLLIKGGVAGTWSLDGTASWFSGVLSGALSISANGTLIMNAPTSVSLYGAITNAGRINWTSSGYMGMQGGTIHNLAHALIDIQSDSTYGFYFSGGSPTITNDGEFRRSGGSGDFPVHPGVAFFNSGLVNVQAGRFKFATFSQFSGARMNFGISSELDFGRILFPGVAPLDGTISANLNNDYVPTSTTSFVVMNYASHSGDFTHTDLPSAVAWQTDIALIDGPTKATLSVLNVRPAINAIANQTGDELVPLSFTAMASDSDVPLQTLTWSLGAAPAGASIGSASGNFNWTPTEAQGPSTNIIQIIVTDDGVPVLSSTNTFTVVVNEVNVAPVLAALANQTVIVGVPVTWANTASDVDLPANTLTFSLLTGPSGAAVDASSGAFLWTPTPDRIGTTNTITVRVVDNGTPPLHNEKSCTINVLPRPTLKINCSEPDVVLHWGTLATADFQLQSSTNLMLSVWEAVTNPRVVVADEYVVTNAPLEKIRFYRLQHP